MAGPTFGEQLRGIVRNYQDAGQPWPAQASDIAAWALREGQWKPHPDRLIRQLADQLAGAMREDYFTDAQGRNVRAKHAARVVRGGVQIMLWDDIRTAPPQHMQIAFQLRRRQIVGDCRQLKTDVDSFNDNSNPSDPIQMVFDFTADIAEAEALEAIGA